VTSSVTSSSFKEILSTIVATNPLLANFEQAALLVEVLDSVLGSTSLKTNPHLAFAQSDRYGFMLIELDGSKLDASLHQLEREELLTDQGDDVAGLQAAVEVERFRVNAGERALYRDFDGEWRRWDHETMTWTS